MRVAIVNITGGGMSGGYRKYITFMLPRLASHPEVDTLLCAAPKILNLRRWFGEIPKVQHVDCTTSRWARYFSPYWSDRELLNHLEKFSPDIIYVPIGRYFRFGDVPVVSMIQNMEPLIDDMEGDPFIGRLKKRAQYADAKKATRRSDRVIAVSEFVREFLVKQWNIPSEKISFVYHGSNPPVPVQESQAPSAVPPEWKGKFLFATGSIRPARGLEDALWAMKELPTDIGVKGLVIAGETTPDMVRYRKRLENWSRAQGLDTRVCWTGQLNEAQMSWCYRNCSVFVMTSRVESFGMIAVEAMAHGCVCIAADNPCLPEVFGNAAVYYPPKDGKSLAVAVRTVLSWDDARRADISEKARKRAETFSWDVAAEKTVGALEETALGGCV